MIIKEKKDFFKIKDIEDISNSPPNSVVLLDYDLEMMKFCKENSISFAVKIKNIKEAVFANSFGAKYVIVDKKNAKEIQDIANEYLFDTKVLVKIVFDWEIEDFAKKGIDGVIKI